MASAKDELLRVKRAATREVLPRLRKRHRDERGRHRTQDEAAALARMDPQTLGRIERAQQEAQPAALIKILASNGVPFSEYYREMAVAAARAERYVPEEPEPSELAESPAGERAAADGDRLQDWWLQALRDLEHAAHDKRSGYYEGTAFLCHQAAEKGVQAVLRRQGLQIESRDSVLNLVEELSRHLDLPPRLRESARALDHHFLAARFPHHLPAGYPGERYSAAQAVDALRRARQVLRFCWNHLPPDAPTVP